MVGPLKLSLNLVLVALVLSPAALHAQGRFRVLIPYFLPLGDADDDFGKDASKELRKLINTLATHEPIEEKEIKDQAKRFDLKIEDLNCIMTRQLASQIDAQVALCAEYNELADKSWELQNVVFWDIASSEQFAVSDITVAEKDDEVAAQHIFNEFDRYVQQIRAHTFCSDYFASRQWENALRNCDQALDLNPDGIGTRYLRGRILYEMENYTESLGEMEKVLALEPLHQEALELAGYMSALRDDDDRAREYYGRYLELNPANAAIRMRIAYDLARAGDPVGGMQVIEIGLEVDRENIDLWEQYGGFAFSAALDAEQDAALDAQNGGGVSPEAQGYYREAIQAYEKVFEGKGAETPVGHLRNIIAAYIQLDEITNAVEVGARVLQTHAQEDVLWSIYADALQRNDQLTDAIAALDRVREINPSHPSARLRQGNWLIQAGRIEDAVAILKEAAANDPQRAEQAARLIFNDAYQKGYQQDNFQYAITGMAAAKELPDLSETMVSQLNFWHGFSVYKAAVEEQAPQTLATAEATLPKFRAAMDLFNQSGAYPASVNVNLGELLANANTYVEIQDAIIKRGR
ncbi:MAG: tetratricopeptide repeat protein [Gemmatimonadetes bacterium]|nr:tetratricopeptide repeat protein [Gemmatimonadota bacterium]